MIGHAKQTRSLYDEMLALDKRMESFLLGGIALVELVVKVLRLVRPWTRLLKPGGEGAQAGKTVDVPAEAGKLRIDVDKVDGVEGYEVIPPRQPIPREDSLGRPALQRPSDPTYPSDPKQPIQAVHHPSASFSDAELSLLTERGITEITPGRWMLTEEQADGRIVLTRAR